MIPLIEGYLLDIGCGMNELVRSYQNGIGVDVYQWGDVDLVVSDTASLPYEDNSFDTITILAALNHIPNRKEVLTECNRLLTGDGRLIITMIPPGISRIWHFLRRSWDSDQKERGMEKGELYGMTKADILAVLDESGFKLVHTEKFMFYINTVYAAEKK